MPKPPTTWANVAMPVAPAAAAAPPPPKSCWGQLLSRVYAPNDTAEMTQRKSAMLGIGLMSIAVAALSLCTHGGLGLYEGYGLFWVWCGLLFVAAGGSLTIMLVTKSVSDTHFKVFIAICCAAVMILDVNAAAGLRTRGFPQFVVLVDIMLVGHMPRRDTLTFVVLIVLWFLLIEAERSFRFGLFDMWGTPTKEMRLAEACTCESPPCTIPPDRSLLSSTQGLFLLLMDFVITRKFAFDAESEHRRMAVVIKSAEHITSALAQFDLTTAQAGLDTHQDALPPELYASFQTLLFNLGSYRPYLPQLVLPVEVVTDSSDEEASTVMDEASTAATATQALTPLTLCIQNSRAPTDVLSGSCALTPLAGDLRTNHLRSARISLLHINVRLPPATATSDTYSTTHEAFVALALTRVAKCRGVVDTFIANKVIASFNAARPAACHAAMAVKTLNCFVSNLPATPQLEGADFAGAIGSGDAVVGVLGAEAMRRPAILGDVPQVVAQLARFGAAAGRRWLCSARTYDEAHFEYEMKIVLDMVVWDDTEEELSDVRPHVYEVCTCTTAGAGNPGDGTPAEWMYQLESHPARKWEAYNDAGRRFLRSGLDVALAHLAVQNVGEDLTRAFTDAAEAGQCYRLALRGASMPTAARPASIQHSIASTQSTITITEV